MDIRKDLLSLTAYTYRLGCDLYEYLAPLIILAVSANIANFTMALSAVATIRLNRKFLPKEFRPALWREAILILNFHLLWVLLFSLFYCEDFGYQILKFERT